MKGMSTLGQVEIERLRYWQGQRLRARDFRDQVEADAQLRWWHNRALHNTFGVRYGLAVSPAVTGRDLVAVEVDCGLAYDCFGRELVLRAARRVTLPPAGPRPAASVTLLIRYKEASGDRSSASLNGPELFWKPTATVEVTGGVPLARVNYTPEAKLDDAFATPISRPLARPRIASGSTVPGDTAWELWKENLSDIRRERHEVPIGVQVTADTSAAGFSQTPAYFAWLQGPLWDKTHLTFFPVPLSHIDNEAVDRFRFRLWLPTILTSLGSRVRTANFNFFAASRERRPLGFTTEFLNFARLQKLHVCWIGVECRPGVESECAEPPECCCVEEE